MTKGSNTWETGNIEGDIDMAKRLISWKTKGMNRDASVSSFNPEFSFENRNIRLATNESNTMMSWVTERGTKDMTLHIDVCPWAMSDYVDTITGSPIGTAVLNHKLVLFTVSGGNNLIYVLWKSDIKDIDIEGKLLFSGNLGITLDNPLETLVSYESESIQKVYWTDGVNQPRVINIAADKATITKWNTRGNTSMFDFVPELQLNETINVNKIFGSGEFPAGVIQYAFTYYNKYGQESNIFYTTPLQYIAYIDRGGSADSKIANSFQIEIDNVDTNFDYLRIYSILRTSINATPLCKRVQDLEIKSDTETLTFIDDGLHGETVDPTELLYKGGEEIIIQTMEQKDGTLFLGNVKTQRRHIDLQESFMVQNNFTKESPCVDNGVIQSTTSSRHYTLASKAPLNYVNTLSANNTPYDYSGVAGFKSREYYRLGVQLQYKNGKWSEPYWIGDVQQKEIPVEYFDSTNPLAAIPEFKYVWKDEGEFTDVFNDLRTLGYKRVRPVFAVPGISDRTILCQGVACPTMYRLVDRYSDAKKVKQGNTFNSTWTYKEKGKLYAQSSWLFRCPTSFEKKSTIDTTDTSLYPNGDASNGGGKVSYVNKLYSQYETPAIFTGLGVYKALKEVSPYLRDTEVMGVFDLGNAFQVDDYLATIHSPELIFDTSFHSIDFSGCILENVGIASLDKTYGDMEIQVSTPAIGSDAAGFIHKSIVTDGAAALISAPVFNDYLVKGLGDDKYEAFNTSSPPVSFPVYMWQKNGSLNNDVSRTNRSAELLKKKISNYRYCGSTKYQRDDSIYSYSTEGSMQLFDSDVLSVVKVDGDIYMGNIETMLTPTTPYPHFITGNPWGNDEEYDYFADSYYFAALNNPYDTSSESGIWHLENGSAGYQWYLHKEGNNALGTAVKGLYQSREPISMKYKSTAHLVVKLTNSVGYGNMIGTNSIYHSVKNGSTTTVPNDALPIVEVVKPYDSTTFFGGTSDETLRSHTWIPCGPTVNIPKENDEQQVTLNFKWGDTYFQRFECLKTYPYTQEDKNQVIEIASFLVETRVNIDGRYDRNRAQTSNLNMTPQNFNLMNPVYSQMDNFFSYKILDEDDYKETSYPNTVTWTKTKQNGADVDLWTNITLANTLEMDGDKGEVTKLTRLNNQLLCFQDKGISQILYNENTQISTTEGVPIEIANSEKVQGKRYLSDIVGCSNKWSMVQTPVGIYFMDSNEKSIYMFNGQLVNISTQGGFNSWAKQNIPSASIKWNPKEFGNFITYYDKANQDVLFINKDMALAYSEKFNCFTSFYDYWKAPFFCTLDDIELWVTNTNSESKIYQHQAGDKYCKFFGLKCPFSMTLVANQEPQVDKIFTNLEFRACIDGEGTYDKEKDKFTPLTPFDNIEVWDEYQHGRLYLTLKNKDNKYTHGLTSGILDRKFRIWRCDIPRDNAPVLDTDAQMGIKRFKVRPLDRIRNPWAYIKLEKDVPIGEGLDRIEVHDIVATYFA